MKIVLVEDDMKLAQLMQEYLCQYDMDIHLIHDGQNATQQILDIAPDVAILDLMLPNKDGLTICRELRSQFSGNIIFLTASDDDMDHVACVELGADDFIQKPILPRVLLARIRMITRRNPPVKIGEPEQPTQEQAPLKSELEFGDLHLALHQRKATLANNRINLTGSEFDLLWLLASQPETILSRDYLYRELRGIEYDGLDRSIDGKVVSLRKKLNDNASLSRRIITVRGQGYLFVPDTWQET